MLVFKQGAIKQSAPVKKCIPIAVILFAASITALVGCAQTNYRAATALPKRTMPARLTDLGIERRVLKNVDNVAGLSEKKYRVAVNAYQGDVLLTGEVPNKRVHDNVARQVASMPDVKRVFNHLKIIETPKSQSHTVHENYLKSKLLAKMLAKGVTPTQFEIVVRDNTAYILGAIDSARLAIVEKEAADTDGLLGFTSLATVYESVPMQYVILRTHQ